MAGKWPIAGCYFEHYNVIGCRSHDLYHNGNLHFYVCCLYIGMIVMGANDKIETIRYQFFSSNVTFIDTATILIKLCKTENYSR